MICFEFGANFGDTTLNERLVAGKRRLHALKGHQALENVLNLLEEFYSTRGMKVLVRFDVKQKGSRLRN